MAKLYAAYGSNLNLKLMFERCPTAKVVGSGLIMDYKLTFRKFLNIEEEKGSVVPVGVFEIQEQDEIELDIYEEYPVLYRKEDVEVVMGDKKVKAMVYIMNDGKIILPTDIYMNKIITGYQDFNFDVKYIEKAYAETKKKLGE